MGVHPRKAAAGGTVIKGPAAPPPLVIPQAAPRSDAPIPYLPAERKAAASASASSSASVSPAPAPVPAAPAPAP